MEPVDIIELQKQMNRALEERSISKTTELLSQGADPNFICNKQQAINRPMIVAASFNFVLGLEILHKFGGQIDSKGITNITPLMTAALNGHVEAGRWLLDHGADINAVTHQGSHAISMALVFERIAFLEMVLQKHSGIRQALLENVSQATMSSGNISLAQWLLKEGLSPDATEIGGKTWLGLMVSSFASFSEPMTELLLQSGADVNLADKYGNRPLHIAYGQRKASSLMILLQAGADPDLPDAAGQSARNLIEALPGHYEIRQALAVWDASKKAHQLLTDKTAAHGLKSL